MAEAGLESQVSPAHDHAEPTVNDGLWRIIPLEKHFDLMPCFPVCIGFSESNDMLGKMGVISLHKIFGVGGNGNIPLDNLIFTLFSQTKQPE